MEPAEATRVRFPAWGAGERPADLRLHRPCWGICVALVEPTVNEAIPMSPLRLDLQKARAGWRRS